jgi:hypothetical protein
MIRPGDTSVTFDIKTTKPSLQDPVTIMASLGDSTQSAILTIGPSVMPTTCPYSCRAGTTNGSGWGQPTTSAGCDSNEIAEYRVSCPSTTQTYSCGFFGWGRCSRQVPSICCRPK